MGKTETLDLNTVVVRSGSSISADADGETVMLNPETSSYYGLDPIGSRIWELLAQPTSVAAICATLEREYKVDAETCRRDVVELVQDLLDERLAHKVG